MTIFVLTVSGAWIARFARLTYVEGALIGLARVAMGGSGDVAILSAARRMETATTITATINTTTRILMVFFTLIVPY